MSGAAFVFGDGIDTDGLAPGYLMKRPVAEIAPHCLEAVDPTFAARVRPGDFLVAGANFGLGSAREQAAGALRHLGVAAVLARSFSRIFYRNAINLGLPALIFPAADEIASGDRLNVEPLTGRVDNLTRGRSYAIAPMPRHLMEMIEAGGLVAHLKRRFAQAPA